MSSAVSFGNQVINYYSSLAKPAGLPKGVEVLYPYDEREVQEIVRQFYSGYYNDNRQRVFLLGINPGRHGAGITGIPFTDPVNLHSELGIENSFPKKHELSSRFIYAMIDALGGPERFYASFYITAVSPVGFVKEGKNLNYYDDASLQEMLEPYMKAELEKQLEFGSSDIAYSLGMGKNIAFLKAFNKKYGFFREVRALPHPRWVMQYRLKKLDRYITEYKDALGPFM